MKIAMILAVAVLLLAGCDKDPEAVTQVGSDFKVGRLFTTEGCTVYRFYDGGRNVYFTNSTGSTSSSYSSGAGKSRSTRNTEVMTTSDMGVTP